MPTMELTTVAKKPKRNDLSAKIDADVLRKVKIVASIEQKEIAELLTEIVGPAIEVRLKKHGKILFGKNPS